MILIRNMDLESPYKDFEKLCFKPGNVRTRLLT